MSFFPFLPLICLFVCLGLHSSWLYQAGLIMLTQMLQDGSQLACDGFVLVYRVSGEFHMGFATLCPITGRYFAVLHPEGSCVRLIVAMT